MFLLGEGKFEFHPTVSCHLCLPPQFIFKLELTMIRASLLKTARVVVPNGVRNAPHLRTVYSSFSEEVTQPSVGGKSSKKTDPNSFMGKLKSYGELSKFRLSSMVVLTSGAGFAAAGLPLDYCTMAAVCAGTALCAGSAGTFNQLYEIEQDSKMKRTIARPLVTGNVSRTEAAMFGLSTGAAGTALLYAATNPVVAALGLANIGLYAGIYTYSKQHTEWNTWIGALVGAIPPVMGWAAATGGSIVAPEPALLASLLFLWQFPHFFALSYLHREDYARGGFEMVAVNDPTGSRSAGLVMEYSMYLTALPILASATGLTSYMFAFEGTAVNLYLLYLAQKFRQDRTNAGAKRVFLCSLWYLPALMAGYLFHSTMWDKQKVEDEVKSDEVRILSVLLVPLLLFNVAQPFVFSLPV